jgi:hypothetical protein
MKFKAISKGWPSFGPVRYVPGTSGINSVFNGESAAVSLDFAFTEFANAKTITIIIAAKNPATNKLFVLLIFDCVSTNKSQ